MKRIKYIIIILLYIFNSNTLHAQKDEIVADKIVAVLSNKMILLSEIEVLHLQAKAENPSLPASYICDILQQKLLEKMLISQAQRDSINISESEVESNLDRRIRYFIQVLGGTEKFEAYYKKTTEEVKDQFREEIKDQLMAQQMQNNIIATVKISAAEVRDYFHKYPIDSLPIFPTTVELLQIVKKPKVSPAQDSLALNKIKTIREEILNGADFGSKAILYSQDPGSAKKGGDLGEVARGVFVPEFEAIAFTLRDGEMSGPVRTEYGWHLIQTLKNNGGTIKVRHILIRPQVTTDDAIKAIEFLEGLRTNILSNKTTFDDAVQRYSDDENSKSLGGYYIDAETGGTEIELNYLDPSMRTEVEKLNLQEISQVIVSEEQGGTQVFRIIKIIKKNPEHKANLNDDFTKIQNVALQEKHQKALEEWVYETKDKNYIWIAPEFADCEVLSKWLK